MNHDSRFPPSGASRWVTCTASVLPIAELPTTDDSNFYAAEGTVAHELLDDCLRSEVDESLGANPVGMLVDQGGFEVEVTQEMHDAVRQCVQYIAELGPGTVLAEQRVSRTVGDIEQFGTMDVLHIPAEAPHHLNLLDLKYGKGVKVEAQSNHQLALYALMTIESLDFMLEDITEVELHIMQPRNGGMSSWLLQVDDLMKLADMYNGAMREALGPDATYRPSKTACRWCPLAGSCKALQERVLAAFEDIAEGPERAELGRLAYFLDQTNLIENAISAARKHALEVILEGGAVPGWKAVEGRTTRMWASSDEDEVADALEAAGVDPWYRKLKSPSQAEKVLTKEEYRYLPAITRPEGKPTLAPESDKRPPLSMAADVGDFDNLTDSIQET